MDHRNKIQSLILPTYGPGDTPDCITEYGPYTCEYGRMCHTAPTAQKYGFSLESELDLAFLVRPEPPNSMSATNAGQQRVNRKIHPCGPGPKNRSKNKIYTYIYSRKSAIFQSLMRGTAKRHGFLHIGAHLVAKGVLGHMRQIHPISTCTQGKSANFSKYGFSLKPTLDWVYMLPTSPLGTSRTPPRHHQYASR